VAGVVFVSPPFLESADNSCAAVERLGFSIVAAEHKDRPMSPTSQVFMRLSNGSMARDFAQQKYPNVPPGLSCGMTYWMARLNPPAA
jgi:hypothetical protein